MRAHYDFSKMTGRKNPYLKLLKQPVTIRLDRDTVAYFKGLAGGPRPAAERQHELHPRTGDDDRRFCLTQAGPRCSLSLRRLTWAELRHQ